MTRKKLLSLLLALTLLASLAVPAFAAETAAVIRLTKTTGTVEISKSSGKPVSLLQNMRLYSGYHVSTDEESYAWINLDDSKLLKEDAASEVEIRKDGKKLDVLLCSGNVFFDVAKPLEDDESLNIRTSTMAVGIRGTSGWVQVVDRWTARVFILEGEVECSVMDPVTGQLKAEPVRGGERATCVVYPQEKAGDKCAILREKFTVDDIPGFVLTQLTRDIPLCDKIVEKSGFDVPEELAKTAGGDPSGRTPEGDSATKEVLDESDRREDEDEADLHKKLEPGAAPEKPASSSGSKDKDSASSAPAPEATPETQPETKPAPTPTPKPQPETKPTPTPTPKPETKPVPVPDPSPAPTPTPTPDTEPEPDTETESTPSGSDKGDDIASGGIWDEDWRETGTDSESTIGSSNKDTTLTGGGGRRPETDTETAFTPGGSDKNSALTTPGWGGRQTGKSQT